ncbi:uncharacterized protein FIBRA_02022 [Fibroporia radiculosa]|uniref:TAP42-like protein n=1 Tax=Fibroporia radiculosa TaxID=599839 RepID=J4HU92_9APHY|nr:uncharacterized protein FIBRA_02022 [Fibroporia radiculosa]CCL99997.1 predicted protein [Fibroporia radiculosa]
MSLPALFRRALNSAAKANNMPTIQDDTQELIQSALSDLKLVHSRISALALFSENELLSDIPTRDLVYLLVPFVLAEVEGRVRTADPEERLERAERSRSLYSTFLLYLDMYEVIPESERAIYAQASMSVGDASQRRDLKIKQYQKEKEIKIRIAEIRKRRNHGSLTTDVDSNFELISSLIPGTRLKTHSHTTDYIDEDDEDDEAEDILREAALLLLRLTCAQAHAQMQSLVQEIQLLRSAPSQCVSQHSEDPRHVRGRENNDLWRLDAPVLRSGPNGKGPLLDPSGKPLRPFTILPSSSSRAQLRAEVFQPDHRLPTMTVDDYLEVERQRGNIISGGGAQSEEAPTIKEQLALDAEMNGTVFGEDKAEEKRQQDERWAQYTDTHQRGAGNTMNRG